MSLFGVEDLRKLFTQYLNLYFTDNEIQEIIAQWADFKVNCRHLKRENVVSVLSGYTMQISNSPFSKLIECVMTISMNTVSCERGFSPYEFTKTNLRTTITQENLRNQLLLMTAGPDLNEFKADISIEHWLLSSETGSRHVHHHKLPGPSKRDDVVGEPNYYVDEFQKIS